MTDMETHSVSNTEASEPNRNEIWILIAVLSVLATITLLMGMVVFKYTGDAFLERRYDTVGEVLMREGERLEDAGMFDLALQRYELAFDWRVRWAGRQNLTNSLKRAGRILTDREEFEAGIPYLERALQGDRADIGAYEPLVTALMKIDRIDEAQKRHQEWVVALQRDVDASETARALYLAGALAEKRNNVSEAMVFYQRNLDNYAHAPSAARLAALYAEQGDADNALKWLDFYFLNGAPGDDNESLRDLRKRLTQAAPQQ